MDLSTTKFIVSGRVQGVGFRYHTAYFGLKLGATGYAKNLWDGDVEVMITGNEEQINQMHHYLLDGPRSARVDNLRREEVDYQAFKGFDIL
ncbi:acylphosphatase [Vibrio panuliri]|uniref:Acylphosphatase n=1 Tax=Vibrio panuliri TaxID=1381081 RepID=A0A1Q9HFD6_9VIBR|nr:acylphosphatase [Vibrio panuliri]OLQ88445.1 acylphosphatase [Vibrio panuliri]